MHTLIVLAILTFLGKFVSGMCDRVRLPSVVGMILLGIILGPTGIRLVTRGDISPDRVERVLEEHRGEGHTETLVEIFPRQMTFEIVGFLALIGVIILLFMAGLETDLRTFVRAGRSSFIIAATGVVVPFASGLIVSLAFDPGNVPRGMVIGTILTATSVSIPVMILMSLKKVQSREGATILTAAIIDDVLGIIVLSIVLATISGDPHQLYSSIGLLTAFMIGAVVIGWYLIPIVMNLSRTLNVSMGVNAIALALMFLFAGAAEISNVAGITGAYLAGLFIGRTQLRNTVREGVEAIGQSFFIPLFFIYIGLQVDLRSGAYNVAFILVLLVVAILGKLVGCGITARLLGFSTRGAFIVGSGMVPRGEVGLVVASLGLRIIGASAFTAAVILVVVSSLVTPLLLTKGFEAKERAHG